MNLEARFRTVFESSRLGNKIIDADLKILEVNPAMLAILGYDTKEEIIGTRIINYTPEEHRHDWMRLQDKLWNTSMPSFSLETCLIRKDGSSVWCKVTSILFEDNGEKLGYTIIEDITEEYNFRKQEEDHINVASHELKTPLTKLKATLQLLNKELGKEQHLNPNIKRLANDATRFSAKLGTLTNDLLNFTQIQKDQLVLNRTTFKVTDLMHQYTDNVLFSEKHHIVQRGDLDSTVYGDEVKIDQVLTNLINNAVKYAPESDEIVVNVVKSEKSLRFEVTDRGTGIPEDEVPKLFDKYYRIKNKSEGIEGSGLGLYISSEIIRRHGGSMGVDSEIGKGSTFWFTIPQP